MVHITGGGFTKLKVLMPIKDIDIRITRNHSLRPHEIFNYAYQLGIPSEKMYSIFNNGIGYVVVVPSSRADDVITLLRKFFPSDDIGEVSQGSGRILIESQFDDKIIKY